MIMEYITMYSIIIHRIYHLDMIILILMIMFMVKYLIFKIDYIFVINLLMIQINIFI